MSLLSADWRSLDGNNDAVLFIIQQKSISLAFFSQVTMFCQIKQSDQIQKQNIIKLKHQAIPIQQFKSMTHAKTKQKQKA